MGWWRASWRPASHKSTRPWSTHHGSHRAGPHEPTRVRAAHHGSAAHRPASHESGRARRCAYHWPSSTHRAAPLEFGAGIHSSAVNEGLKEAGAGIGDREVDMCSAKQAILVALRYWCALYPASTLRFLCSKNAAIRAKTVFKKEPRPSQAPRSVCDVIDGDGAPLTPIPPGMSELFTAPMPKEPEPIGPRGPEPA